MPTPPDVGAPGAIIPFAFDENEIRAIVDGRGEPWFVAADIAEVLDYRDAYNLVRGLDDDEKGTQIVSTPGGAQNVVIISEPGLYTAIVRSHSVRTQRFRRWVTHEVLPCIRRTGSYGVAKFDPTDPRVIVAVLEAQVAKVAALESTVAEQRAELAVVVPKAAAYDAFADADGLYTLSNAGRALQLGPRKFIDDLKAAKVLFYQGGDLLARSYYVEHGYFTHRAVPYLNHKTGETGTATQVHVTPKGLTWLASKIVDGKLPVRRAS